MKAIKNHEELEASLVAFLNEEGYLQHDSYFDEGEVVCPLHGHRVLSPKRAVIVGFDFDAEMYFVTGVLLKDGEWEFAEDSLGWWEEDELDQAIEYFNTVKKV